MKYKILLILFVLFANAKATQDIKSHKYFPSTRDELVALINDMSVNLAEIDTSKITDMSFLFARVSEKKCKNALTKEDKEDMFYILSDVPFSKLGKRHRANCLNTAHKRLELIRDKLNALESAVPYKDKSTQIKHIKDKIAEQKLCKDNFSTYIAPKIKSTIFDKEFDTWFDEHAPRGKKIGHTRRAYLTSAEKKEITNSIIAKHKSCEIITNDEIKSLEALEAEQKRYDEAQAQIMTIAKSLYAELGAIDSWDTSNVVDMSYMFYKEHSFGFSDWTRLIDKGLDAWNVSKVQSMRGIFAGANYYGGREQSKYLLSNHWDTSEAYKGTNYAKINSSLGIDKWRTDSLVDLGQAFAITNFAPNINAWNVSKVQKMDKVFFNNTNFNNPLDSWDTSSVKTMQGMFALTDSFNQPINSWNVSSVEDMSEMFSGIDITQIERTAFDQPLDKWDTRSVKNMELMFNMSSFNQPLNSWNVSNVENMAGMFAEAKFQQPLDLWDISKVKDFRRMFGGFSDTDYTQIKSLESWGEKLGKKVKGGIKAVKFGYAKDDWYRDGMFGDIRLYKPSSIENYPKWLIKLYKKDFDKMLKEAIQREQEDSCNIAYNAQSQIDKDFIQAVQDKDLLTIKELHKNGANINAKDKYCHPALHIATKAYNDKNEQNRYEVIEFLLKNGANVNSVDNYGNTALIKAMKRNYGPFIYESVEYKNALKIIKLLIESGANINAQNHIQTTALIEASAKGHYDAVKLLVANGADINAVDRNGDTALHIAIIKIGDKYKTKAFYKILEFLLTNGADVNLKNNNGKDALGLAQYMQEQPRHKNDDRERIIKLISQIKQTNAKSSTDSSISLDSQ